MKIIIVAGMPGAGKEEFLSVAGSLGIPSARMGDVVRDAHSERGGSMSVGEFANAERERYGKNIWAKRTIERMSGGLFLIDGSRSMEEVRSFRELGGDTLIVGIYSSPGQRYKRLVLRGRGDAPNSIDEFNIRDSRELSWGLGEVLALADMMILNTSSLDEFRSFSKKVLRELK